MSELKRRTWGLVAASAILMGAGGSGPLPPESTVMDAPQARGERASDGGLRRDARAYATEHGVGVDEAIRRLELQQVIGELGAALEEREAATFAGLYIEHKPEYRVVARFTREGEATLRRYVGAGALARRARAEGARLTLAELRTRQQASLEAVQAQGLQAEADINLRENRVEVYVQEGESARAMLSGAALALPDGVTVTAVPALSQPEAPIYGGAYLSGWSSSCTGGFPVRHSSGTLGYTTAAHCEDSQWVWDYVDEAYYPLTFQGQLYDSYRDVQWHTTPGYTPDNWVYTGGSSYREITSARGRTAQSVGDWVCKYGITTYYTCGYIESTSYNSYWVLVGRAGYNLSEPGDSGGPWFSGNAAYGIHSAGSGDKSIYMPINYISGLGISVLTY